MFIFIQDCELQWDNENKNIL